MRYLFATNNQGKMKEIEYIFAEAGLEIISLAGFGLSHRPEETGTTFEENAIIKAKETAAYVKANHPDENIAVLSDDSGLCIDALGGIPGVDSPILWAGKPLTPPAMPTCWGNCRACPSQSARRALCA